jgi:hypothetical protein
MKVDVNSLTEILIKNMYEMPTDEAFHAVGLMRSLLVRCGGLKHQHSFPRSRRTSCSILTIIFGTFETDTPCSMETTFEFIRQNAEGDIFAFSQEEDKRQFEMKCVDLMEKDGFTCPSGLVCNPLWYYRD